MNAASVLEAFELKQELEEENVGKGEKFRMSRRLHSDVRRKRPKQHNGIHRRRRKKIRL